MKHFLFSLSYDLASMRLFPSNMLNFEKHHAGLKVLSSRLKKLENLYLCDNHFNDSIFSSITGFSSLKSLDLSFNEVTVSGSFYGDRLII